MSRFLVTGATGFLGIHLVRQLREAGHDVVAVCRAAGGTHAKGEALLGGLGATIRRGDVLDGPSIADAAAGCEGAFHCAGKVSRKPEDAGELYRLHVDGTKITLDACKSAGVRRVVVASTSGVVCVSKDPDEIRDETAPAPMDLIAGWPYYRSKLFAEQAALDRNVEGFEVLAVNPTLLLGPGDEQLSSTSDVVRFLEKRVPIVPAGGLSFVDARDAAAAMVLAMERGRPGMRYLVAAANMTIEAFFGRLERISGVAAPKLKAPRSMLLARAGAELMERAAKRLHRESPVDRVSAEMGQRFWYVDSSRARNELGWAPRDPNETLGETVADLLERGVVWPRSS